jgi:hydrogenase nickel incorporation protein HypA/HybF
MHEYILADRLLQSVLEHMKSQGLTTVCEVDIDVGELLGLENESLRMAYEILSKGTKGENCKLKIRRIKGSVVCDKCGYTGGLASSHAEHMVDPAFACPRCGSPVTIKAGNDLKITRIS